MILGYLALYLSNIVDATGDIIDTGFTNSLGINEICIFGILCSIHGLCYTICCYGTYVFRITGKNAKECLFLTVLLGAFVSVVLMFTSPVLWHIWYIEPELREMLRICIFCLGLCEIPRAVSIFLVNYMQYTSQGGLCTKLFILFYICMFAFDVVAVFYFRSLPFVVIGTGLSNVIFDIVAYYKCGVRKHSFKLGNVLGVVQTGLGYFLERIFSRLSLSLYEASATYLGTYEYAVFTVSCKVFGMARVVINTLQIHIVSGIRKANKVELGYAKNLYKGVRWVCILLFIFPALIGLFIAKGELNAFEFIIPLGEIYLAYFSGVYYIINYSVFSVINDKKKFVVAGVVRLMTTAVLVGISMLFRQYAVYILIMYYFLVYLTTGFYMKWVIKKCTM